MNTEVIIVVVVVLCCGFTIQDRKFLKTTLESKANFFHKIYFDIHVITNNLLLTLKSNRNFTKSDHFRMLLTMHSYFKSIAEGNYLIYEDLRNISHTNSSETHEKHLDTFLEDVAEDEIDKITDHFMKLIQTPNDTEIENNMTKLKDSEDIVRFLSNVSPKSNNMRIETMIDALIIKNVFPNISIFSNETNKCSKIENSHEIFYKILLKLSDKAIENVLYSIANETEKENANNSLQELKTWHPAKECNKTRRIYKGKKTRIRSYPFVASVHLMSEFLCVGSIISMDMVLTAASCLQIAHKNKHYRNNPRVLFVRVGSDRTKRYGKLIPIVKVIFHPSFDPVTLKHNLAIVKMLKKLRHMKKIKKIKYDRNPAPLLKNVKGVTILGWGAKNSKDKAKGLESLTMSHLDIYNTRDCKEIYSKYYVTDTNFCAGFSSKGSGACMGDVGAPAIFAEELIGIVNFGPTVCGSHDSPTVFTKLGFYAKWIDGVINQKPTMQPIRSSPIAETIKMTDQDTSNVVMIPLYTTKRNKAFTNDIELHPKYTTHREHHTKHTVSYPDHTISQMRNKVHDPITESFVSATDEPEEIQILKKLVSEFILGNNTIIDYLTNAELEDYDFSYEKLFVNPKKGLIPFSDTKAYYGDDINLGQTFTSNNYKNKLNSNVSQLIEYLRKRPTKHYGTGNSVTRTTLAASNDDLPLPTKLATFVESSEFPELASSEEDISISSSNYKEILIEDGPFKKGKKHAPHDTQIDLEDFVENSFGMANENPKRDIMPHFMRRDDDLFNIYQKPGNKGLIPEPTYKERELYKLYNMMDWGPDLEERKVRSEKNERKTNTDEKDMIVHFVNDNIPRTDEADDDRNHDQGRKINNFD